ncbi:hypothetical protein TNCV_378111, partial [Trichonephila clavipes]
TTQLSCRKKFNSPPQLENQSQCRRKTTQFVSRNETTQLNRRKTTQLGNMNENNSTGENNSTQQQERTTFKLGNSERKFHQPALPSTACTAFTAESAFSTLLTSVGPLVN